MTNISLLASRFARVNVFFILKKHYSGLSHFIKVFKDAKRGLDAAGEEIPVELIRRHENWNRRSQWDIAIIKFAKPVASGKPRKIRAIFVQKSDIF